MCEKNHTNYIIIAGDVFQSIFDHVDTAVKPDYLLKNCYRTDPRTLMFSHAIGLGLFEDRKLNWLQSEEWEACGYKVFLKMAVARVNREPIRRFEDLSLDENSVELFKQAEGQNVVDMVVDQIIKIALSLKSGLS